ncbi:MAG: hypothetical protein KJ576_21005 [Proteobacteria bacterium]|nr:hypothetical protein [Pseudomonadota bacterium]
MAFNVVFQIGKSPKGGISMTVNQIMTQSENRKNTIIKFMEQIFKLEGERIARLAQRILNPIYTDRRDWYVSGQLRDRIKYTTKIGAVPPGLRAELGDVMNGMFVVVWNEVPYARLRHYTNKAHPQTIGYFTIAFHKSVKSLTLQLGKLAKALQNTP